MKVWKVIRAVLRCLAHFFVSLFGILGWLAQGVISALTLSVMIAGLAGFLVYVKVKPELDHCREVAYDKLAQMNRQDFHMLSDTEVYDKDGKLVGLINAGHYEYVPINEISMNIQNAYIAQEDRRFKTHTGVDWIATARAGLALVKNRGEITQGGSTITQQVIKNTYLTQERSFTRKMVEILLAPQVEKKYSKADIMEFYCNTNFYGNHCYGVAAASRYYFGKSPSELTAYEAAVLVGLSNSPTAYNPVRNPEASKKKRNDVLKSMHEVGYLSDAEYKFCTEQPLSIVQEEGEGTDENYQCSYALHCAALTLMKLDNFEFRYTFTGKEDYETYIKTYQEAYAEKNDELRAGGYKIYTSLDSELQWIMQDRISENLSSFAELQDNGKYALQGAGVIVDNKTNYVVAVVGGRDPEDLFNRAYLSARQPGSTIKPLLDYTPAFDTGRYTPATIVDDHQWEDGPSNSGGHYYGEITVREALNRSLNTVAWQVLQDIGVNFGLNYLNEMEFQKLTYVDNDVASLSIGGFTNGVRVVDMAKGYSTLANMGMYNDRTCIMKIEHEHDGEITSRLYNHTKRVYREDSAYMTTDILKGTLTMPYGTGYGLGLAGGMPAAGKTGTTNGSKDTWFCGYTKYYTTAVWVGYDIPRPMPGIYGSTYAGRIWKQTMDQIHADLEPEDWEIPYNVEMRTDEYSGITDLEVVSDEPGEIFLEMDEEEKKEPGEELENDLDMASAEREFFDAVKAMEELTVRTEEADILNRTALNKLVPLYDSPDYPKYRERLLSAIRRLSTLPDKRKGMERPRVSEETVPVESVSASETQEQEGPNDSGDASGQTQDEEKTSKGNTVTGVHKPELVAGPGGGTPRPRTELVGPGMSGPEKSENGEKKKGGPGE